MSQACKIRIRDGIQNNHRTRGLRAEEIEGRLQEVESLTPRIIQVLLDPDDNPTEMQLLGRLRVELEQERVFELLNRNFRRWNVASHKMRLLFENYRNGIPDVLKGLDLEAFVPLAREEIFGCRREEEEQWDVVPKGAVDPYAQLQLMMIFQSIQNLLEINWHVLCNKQIVDGVVILAHIDSLVPNK